MGREGRDGACAKGAPDSCIRLVPIFAGLSPSEIEEITSLTTEKTFGKAETIYFAGKSDKRLYVIHSGRVKISRLNPAGRSQIIRVLGPGEFFGELTILSNAPLPDYAEAVEPCRMCMIEGNRLKALMRNSPSIAIKIMEELSSRLERAETRITDISLLSADERLARSILELAGDRLEFDLALSKGDYASQLGMTQETLSRRLASFQERGLIGLRGQRTILLLDREGLGAAVGKMTGI